MEEDIYWKIFFSHLAVLCLSVAILFFAKFSLISVTVILTLLFVFSTALTSFMIHNIDRISNAIFDISRGEFKPFFPKRSRSEFRRIEEAITELQERLSGTIGELSGSQEKLRTILASMAEGVIAVDKKENIILINKAAEELLSFKQDEVLGRNFIERVRQPDILDLIRAAIAGRGGERQITIPSSKKTSLLVNAVPIAGGGAVAVISDITRLKQLEEMRSEFTANVSHELKTPLTVIRSSAETLIDGAVNDKEHNMEFLKKITNNSERLSALIDDVLELSSLDEKRQAKELPAVNAKDILDRALDMLSGKIRDKKVSMSIHLPDPALKVLSSEDHLFRVFLNLIDNAVKYNKEKGAIEISAASENGMIKFTVKDSGIGIDEQHLPRIFERFYTVDRARSREMGGTGLGLAIVKHIVELNGGLVSVSSSPDSGSAFTFTLKKA